jgi:hypothetical protein
MDHRCDYWSDRKCIETVQKLKGANSLRKYGSGQVDIDIQLSSYYLFP